MWKTMGSRSLTPANSRPCLIPGLLLAMLCLCLICGGAGAADTSHPDLYPYPYQKNVVCYYQKWVCDGQGCRYVDAVCQPCSHPGNPDPACKGTVTVIPTYESGFSGVPVTVPPERVPVTVRPVRTYYPDEPDTPWILVIGAIGVLGVGAVIGAKLLGGKKPAPVTPGTAGQKDEKEKEKKKEESVTYILQLSANDVSVTPDEPVSLSVAIWKKVGDSPPVPEPGAVVTVENPADSGLLVTPLTGNSPLKAEIALAGEMKRPSVILGITATAGGTDKESRSDG